MTEEDAMQFTNIGRIPALRRLPYDRAAPLTEGRSMEAFQK